MMNELLTFSQFFEDAYTWFCWPYKTRVNKGQEKPWEVFTANPDGEPTLVEGFATSAEADKFAKEENYKILLTLAAKVIAEKVAYIEEQK
jgi:hypothetical protein